MSTASDIDRFFTALWGGDLLDPELVEVMSRGHSGAASGFNTRAWTLPDAGRSVVVLVNAGDGYTIVDSLAAAALCL